MAGTKRVVEIPPRIVELVGARLEHAIVLDIIDWELEDWLMSNDVKMGVGELLDRVTEILAHGKAPLI